MNKNEKKKFNHSISIEYHLLHFSISFLSSAAAAGYYRKKEEWTNEGENRLSSPLWRTRTAKRRSEKVSTCLVDAGRKNASRCKLNIIIITIFIISSSFSFFCFWAKKKVLHDLQSMICSLSQYLWIFVVSPLTRSTHDRLSAHSRWDDSSSIYYFRLRSTRKKQKRQTRKRLATWGLH